MGIIRPGQHATQGYLPAFGERRIITPKKKTGPPSGNCNDAIITGTNTEGNDQGPMQFCYVDPEPPPGNPIQDLLQPVYDHDSESVGSPSADIPGVWSRSSVPSSPNAYADWEIKAAGDNPVVTGSQHWSTELEQLDGQYYRTERSGSQQAAGRHEMESLGSNNYRATETLWYGGLLRIDEMDIWGVQLDPPKGGGILFQWHERNFNGGPGPPQPDDKSPPLALVHQLDGLHVRLEDNDDNGGSTFFSPVVLPPTIIGETHAYIFEIFWDTRTAAEGSQGVIRLYIDDNTTPHFEWVNKQTVHPTPWLDQERPPRAPYIKWGGYRRDFEFFTVSLPNGTRQRFSWDYWVMHGGGANREGVLESMNWGNVA